MGDCPYPDCDGTVWEALPEGRLPVFAEHTCETCKRVVWTKFSRIDPMSWTKDDFFKEFRVDLETKTVIPVQPVAPE